MSFDPESNLRQRTRAERAARGMSQAELSEAVNDLNCGIKFYPTTVAKIESGSRASVSLNEASAIAQVFGLTLNEISGSMPKTDVIRAALQRQLASMQDRAVRADAEIRKIESELSEIEDGAS